LSLAAKRLSTDVHKNFFCPTSSVVKGEGLNDTALTVQALGADFIIYDTLHSGGTHLLAKNLSASVINAGMEHTSIPTQALLDAFNDSGKERK